MNRCRTLALRAPLIVFLLVAFLHQAPDVQAQESGDGERKRLFQRIFSKKEEGRERMAVPWRERVHDAAIDERSDTISVLVDTATAEWAGRENDPVERYPAVPGYQTLASASQKDIEDLIAKIYEAYEARVARMDPPDLRSARTLAMGVVPVGFSTVWREQVDSSVWGNEASVSRDLETLYRQALEHSNHLKVYRDIPLIRETGMQEADGEFDIETFIDGRLTRRNDPIGSSLDTGTAASRFLEHHDVLEAGLRKKLSSGAQVSLSNRLSTLSNNSSFLVPQNQGASELVLSVAQPLLQGAGYHYNQSKIKLAKLDARTASAEFVRHLESHLVEINRAYWSLYYSRAYYILARQLVSDTSAIVERLEARSDLDALQSEVLRSRAALAMRRSMLNRAEMDVRNNQERLRALINDPSERIGSDLEMVPNSPPILDRYFDDVRSVSKDALHNRPEILQGFDALRASIVRRDMQKNERLPTLNLIADLVLGDIEPNDRVGAAFENQFGDGTGYMVGFQFSQPWDNDTARARLLRSEFELRQQAARLRAMIDLVLLESLVSYREMMAAYRDMQGRYSTLNASREELRQLRERLEIDSDQEGGRTIATQLQLILDSMDRNQAAEELFLASVVSYNIAFTSLQRARGTFLRSENVRIDRVRDTDPTHPRQELESLRITKVKPGAEAKGGGQTAARSGSVPEPPSWEGAAVSETASEFAAASGGALDLPANAEPRKRLPFRLTPPWQPRNQVPPESVLPSGGE